MTAFLIRIFAVSDYDAFLTIENGKILGASNINLWSVEIKDLRAFWHCEVDKRTKWLLIIEPSSKHASLHEKVVVSLASYRRHTVSMQVVLNFHWKCCHSLLEMSKSNSTILPNEAPALEWCGIYLFLLISGISRASYSSLSFSFELCLISRSHIDRLLEVTELRVKLASLPALWELSPVIPTSL